MSDLRWGDNADLRWDEPARDPYREQDLQPWERDFENRYAFDPESEES